MICRAGSEWALSKGPCPRPRGVGHHVPEMMCQPSGFSLIWGEAGVTGVK